MKRTSFVFAAIAAALLTAGYGCSRDKGKKPENGSAVGKPQAVASVIEVKTAEAAGMTVQRSADATGTLLAWDEAVVSSEVPGTVESVSADLGDSVKAGQALMTLDQREARLNLEDAEAMHQTNIKTLEKQDARLQDAKTTLSRYEDLHKQGMVSTSQYDNAKTSFDVISAEVKEAQARLQQSGARVGLAKKKLADTVIKSPIAGQVKKRFVSKGESVREKTPLYTVVSTGTLKFRGTVPEYAAPVLKTGQAVKVTVEAFKDRPFNGKTTRVSPSVDQDTRTIEMEAAVANPDGALKPGFFARGTIFTGKDEGVTFVPSSAVYSLAGMTKIFVITGNKAQEVRVKTGMRQGDTVEVEGVKPGQAVAVSNLSNLYDGADVRVVN